MLDRVLGPRASYDLIAPFYEYDMGRNMPFDDVRFYSEMARQAGRTTLELGCGTGRITAGLVRLGLEVTCVDISGGMLREMCRRLGSPATRPAIVQMDIARWSLNARFDSILCPYSLITYVADAEDVSSLLENVGESLNAGATFVVDAFCCSPAIRYGERMLDYRRTLPGGGWLTRWKVIERDGAGIHLIRRFYEQEDAGGVLRATETSTRIRYYTPGDLAERLERASLHVFQTHWDYGASRAEPGARFVSYCCKAK
jgi:SAM-dependent methyltransferase